jgi:cell wall-associated NlpC family hydrolase
MKKKLFSVILASSIVLSSVPIHNEVLAAAQSATIVSGVSFREGPSTSEDRIRYLKTGEEVSILDQTNTYWYKIQTRQGEIGYVSTNSKYIEVTSSSIVDSPELNEEEQLPDANATVASSVSFRSGPSTGYDRIRYLKTGETLVVLEETNAYWYKVKTSQGDTGYVSSSSKYIELTSPINNTTDPEPIPVSEPSTEAQLTDSNATVVNSVSFRSGPSTGYDRIRYLKTGETLVVLEETNAYWYKVKTNQGDTGYVSSNSRYINTDYIEPIPTIPASAASAAAQSVIDAGMKYLGTPYEYGSSRSNTDTFDCSDFVRQAFLDGVGIQLPADSRQQGDYVQNIGKTSTNWRDLKPGDILFFMSYEGYKASDYIGIDKSSQRITHNAIYLGDGKILHTYSAAAGGVKIDSLEGTAWEYRIIFGGSAF